MLGFVNIYIITKIAKDLASEREKRELEVNSLLCLRFDSMMIEIFIYILKSILSQDYRE